MIVCFWCLPDIFSIDGTDNNVFLYQPLSSQIANHKNGLGRFDSHILFSWDQWQIIHWFVCINQRLILWIYGSFTPDFVTDICLNCLVLCEPLFICSPCSVSSGCMPHIAVLVYQSWLYHHIQLQVICSLAPTQYYLIYSTAEHLSGQFPPLIIIIFLMAHRAAVIYLYFWKQSCPNTALKTTKSDRELLLCNGCFTSPTAMVHGFTYVTGKTT